MTKQTNEITSRQAHFPNKDKKHSEKFVSELKIPSVPMKQPLYAPEDLKELTTHMRIVSNVHAADEVDNNETEESSDTSTETATTDNELGANDAALESIEPGLDVLESDNALEGEDSLAPTAQEVESENEDEMALVDVEGMDDTIASSELESVVASASLIILSNNKSIAYMDEKLAIKAKMDDVYLADEFPLVVASQIDEKGLREGLTSLGFKLTPVNLSEQKVIKASVNKKTVNFQKEITAKVQEQKNAYDDSLAIVAVGMTRGYFKNIENPLKTALIAELENTNVRNAAKIVNKVFAATSIGFVHTLTEAAEKLAAMPKEVRANHMQALDMISEDADIDDGVDLDVDLESNEDGNNEEIPPTVEAAVAVPPKVTSLTAKKSELIDQKLKEILAGKRDLPIF